MTVTVDGSGGTPTSKENLLRFAIFCGPSALTTVQVSLGVYRAAALGLQVELVTPLQCWEKLAPVAAEFGASLRIDEELEGYTEVLHFLQTQREQLSVRGRSVSWYLQQYLKLTLAWRAADTVFVHDGDTVFAPALLKRMASAPSLLTTKEDITAYSLTARRLGLPCYPKSFIANGGLFIPSALQALGTDPAGWFIDAIRRGVLECSESRADFSEYQIMGALLVAKLPVKPLRIFRRFELLAAASPDAGTLAKVTRALERYEAVAFETGHQASRLKQMAARLAYLVGHSW